MEILLRLFGMDQVSQLYNRMLPSIIHKNNTLTSGGAVFVGSASGTESGSVDGTGSNARFSSPTGIVSDVDGNFYVSDSANHTIRKVTKLGVVTTHFGTVGESGSTLTTLNSPRGLALDSDNNLFIADYSNNRILRLADGASTATNLGLVKLPDEIAVNSNGTRGVFRSSLSTGANLIQYRDGVIEGPINTVFNNKPYNIASVACTPNGKFYYCSKDGQFSNQIGIYKMTLQPPNNRIFNVTSTGTYSDASGVSRPAIYVDEDPVLAGVAVGAKFYLSGFDTPVGLNGYSENLAEVITIAGSPSTGVLTFPYTGSNYVLGTPDVGFVKHSQCNSQNKYKVLAIGWDKLPLVGNESNAPSPEQELRMNFYLKNRTYSFPSIQPNTGVTTTIIETGTTSFEGFTGEFTPWNNITVSGLYIYDYSAGGEVVFGGSGNFSFINNLTAANFDTISPLGGYIFGPNIKPGTVITQYTHGTPGIIRTNNQWAFMSPAQADVAITLSQNTTDTKTFTVPANTKVFPGMRIKGSSADGVTILSVSFNLPSVITGTIKTDYPFDTVQVTTTTTTTEIDPRTGQEITTTTTTTTNNSFTLDASYEFGPWTLGSSRVVKAVFTYETFPGSTGANRKCTITSIANNPTAVSVNGSLYGTYIDNMQFSRTDSNTLYASFQAFDGITRYTVQEAIGPIDFITGNVDSIGPTDSNVEIPKPSKFAILPNSSELIALVPEATSNHIKIFENVY